MRHLLLVVVSVAGGVVAAQPPNVRVERAPPARDAVERWNEAALAMIRTARTPPPVAARNLALLHIAMYDAVVSVEGGYAPFYFNAKAQAGTDATAAASVAAHRALLGLYPDRVRDLDAALDDTLTGVPDGPAKTLGVNLGQVVAERVLKWRAKDTTVRRSGYTPRLEAGRWRPTDERAPLLPEWGSVSGFAVADRTKHHPSGPPALDSAEYIASYRTVKALGSKASTERTRDQTEIALFWADGEGTVTPPGHWNRIARSAAGGRKLSLVENARLYALLNVAMADAGMICWECKYRSDFWRPVTAIRAADPNWTPLITTPPFPSYTSGHSSFSGAAAAALAAYFKTDEVEFTSTADDLPGVTRSFKSFTAAAEEAGMSRIYGGIHWDFDNTDGLKCGRAVAEHVAKNFFEPSPAVRRD
jgi:PAP2 superfamily protein